MSEEIKVCERHPERLTPLIWTFAFPGAEYWCPHCGYTGGMFGAGRWTPSTLELEGRLMGDEAASQDYLKACGVRACVQVHFGGKWIAPQDLPEDVRAKHKAVIAAWRDAGRPS